METAKVDVRKLQMLNDRINQTIDALNQVRLSVHGMNTNGTTAFANGTTPFIGAAFPGLGVSPAFAQTFPYNVLNTVSGIGSTWTHPVQALQQLQQQLQLQQLAQVAAAQVGGVNPYFTQSFSPYAQAFNPYVQAFSPFAFGTTPFSGVNAFNGINPLNTIASTIGSTMYADPFTTNRIAQTFPFAQWGYSPLASGSWPSASQMS
jgi:hypothetical protein